MSQGKPPPNDPDAEAAVLSACMLKKGITDLVADILRPEHFFSNANRDVYAAALELTAKGEPVDTVTVLTTLRSHGQLAAAGGPAYIAQLVDATPAVAHVETHARKVRDLWRLRQLIETTRETCVMAYGAVGDIQDYLDQAEAKIRRIAEPEKASATVTLGESISSAFRALRMAAGEGKRTLAVKTGLTAYDELTTGWHPGDLIILAGRPGMGKTACAAATAVNIAAAERTAEGYTNHVAFFSLEMPHDQISGRMACAEARVDVKKLRSGELNSDDWRALTEASVFLSALPMHIDDTSGMTPIAIRAKSRRIAQAAAAKGHRLAAIYIDHCQILKVDGMAGKNGRKDQEIGAATTMFKGLAKELRCPVILLSQLNRAVERTQAKRPTLADLKESGDIEQDADVVTFVHREEYYHHQAGTKCPADKVGVADLITAKQRNGPAETVSVGFDGRYTLFRDLRAA